MYNPYSILGVSTSCHKDDARQAYRRLASKFHPDKLSSDADKAAAEEQFKKIKSAWEAIDNGWIPLPVSSFTAPQSTLDCAKTRSNVDSTKWHDVYSPEIRPDATTVTAYEINGSFIARPSITQAFYGFVLIIPTFNGTYRIKILPGIPSGISLQITLGAEIKTVKILFTQSQYSFQSIDTAKIEHCLHNGEPALIYRTKDLHTSCEINLAKFRHQTEVKFIDVAGQPFVVKINKSQNFRKPIEIPGHGYFDWITSHSIADTKRGSVFVHFITTEKVEMSHNL